jgi:hypothetical protein
LWADTPAAVPGTPGARLKYPQPNGYELGIGNGDGVVTVEEWFEFASVLTRNAAPAPQEPLMTGNAALKAAPVVRYTVGASVSGDTVLSLYGKELPKSGGMVPRCSVVTDIEDMIGCPVLDDGVYCFDDSVIGEFDGTIIDGDAKIEVPPFTVDDEEVQPVIPITPIDKGKLIDDLIIPDNTVIQGLTPEPLIKTDSGVQLQPVAPVTPNINGGIQIQPIVPRIEFNTQIPNKLNPGEFLTLN